jgi:hypothetical protein
MPFFKYRGERPRQAVAQYGSTQKIEIPKGDGGTLTLEAANPSSGFVVGEQIPQEITDAVSLLALRADPRFEEVR